MLKNPTFNASAGQKQHRDTSLLISTSKRLEEVSFLFILSALTLQDNVTSQELQLSIVVHLKLEIVAFKRFSKFNIISSCFDFRLISNLKV